MKTTGIRSLLAVLSFGALTTLAAAQTPTQTPLNGVGPTLPAHPLSSTPPQQSTDGDEDRVPNVRDRAMHPMFVSGGVMAPTTLNHGFDDPFAFTCNGLYGADLAFGYVFPSSFLDLRFSARVQSFAWMNDNVGVPVASFGLLSVEALARYKQYYFGPGIGHATSSGTLAAFSNQLGRSATVLSLVGGTDASPNVFYELRYQTSPVGIYGGLSAIAGLRF